jgi:hypothetical protein
MIPRHMWLALVRTRRHLLASNFSPELFLAVYSHQSSLIMSTDKKTTYLSNGRVLQA